MEQRMQIIDEEHTSEDQNCTELLWFSRLKKIWTPWNKQRQCQITLTFYLTLHVILVKQINESIQEFFLILKR